MPKIRQDAPKVRKTLKLDHLSFLDTKNLRFDFRPFKRAKLVDDFEVFGVMSDDGQTKSGGGHGNQTIVRHPGAFDLFKAVLLSND